MGNQPKRRKFGEKCKKKRKTTTLIDQVHAKFENQIHCQESKWLTSSVNERLVSLPRNFPSIGVR